MLRFPPLRLLAIPAVLSLALSAGCTWVTSKDHVLFTSDPLGARVFVDGTDTGQTTPIKLPIAGTFGFDHEIRLEKKGYRPEIRRITQHTEGYTSKWIDGAWDPTMPPLPFFWTFGDLVFPFGIRAAIVPGELHVKLYREDEPLRGGAENAGR
ncbi:MAG: PEGA domain-containing protein [bacterium]|nr:PEGA domain-containing protein [bacterium]